MLSWVRQASFFFCCTTGNTDIVDWEIFVLLKNWSIHFCYCLIFVLLKQIILSVYQHLGCRELDLAKKFSMDLSLQKASGCVNISKSNSFRIG